MADRHRAWTTLRARGPAIALDLGINLVLPFVIYSELAPIAGDVKALLASSIPPIAWSLIEFVRKRRLDAISLIVLAGIVLSILAFFGGGGPRMLQLREKLVTGIIGIAFLVSAAIGRPIIYQFARAGMMRQGSGDLARLESLRDDRLMRRSMTIMTVVWGFALILDVAIGAAMIFSMTIKAYLLLAPIEGYAFMGAVALWTLWYSRRSKRKNAALRAAGTQPGGPTAGM